jgi:hypothetical protein
MQLSIVAPVQVDWLTPATFAVHSCREIIDYQTAAAAAVSVFMMPW